MKHFKLDARLQNDCFIVAESEHFIFLLMNNSLVPWFIIVPKTDKTELHELDITTQSRLFTIINKISARVCDELDLEGYTDWFLPSKDELILMYQNLHKATSPIGNFQTEFYWSSTEDDEGDAWLQEFNTDGDQNYDSKDALHSVRAVRVFVKE